MGPRWGVEVEESLSTAARIEITEKYARAYAEAPEKGKTQILDQVVEVTGLEPGPCILEHAYGVGVPLPQFSGGKLVKGSPGRARV